jgi:hypothetical protein
MQLARGRGLLRRLHHLQDIEGAGTKGGTHRGIIDAGIIAAMQEAAPLTIEQLYYGRHRLAFRAGTYLALIRMMGIGHLVTALYGHTQLLAQTHARLARTRATLRELICDGFDSPRGQAAVQRLRDVHRGLQATPEDFRYVLATFFLEPLRWNEEFGRAPISPRELDLLLGFWHRVGESMHIDELPLTLAQWRAGQRDYEQQHLRFTEEGRRLAQLCLRDVVKLTVPAGTRWAFRRLMRATMEPSVRQVLRLEPVSPFIGWTVRRLLAGQGLGTAS